MNLKQLVMNLPKLPKSGIKGPRFKPVSTKSVKVRFIPGEYRHSNGSTHQVYEIFQHFNSVTRKFQICSSRWVADKVDPTRLERDPDSKCIGCHLSDSGAKHISLTRKFPTTLYVCDDFHLDPLDYNGNRLGMNDEGKQKYYKTMCTGEGCKGCERGLEIAWGRRMYWEIPQTYLQTLISFQDEAADICANCGSEPDDEGKGGLSLVSLCCPTCGAQMKFNSDFQAKLIGGSTDYQCDNCEETISPEEILSCADCKNPKRPKIFDMDFWIRVSSNKPPSLTVTKYKVKPPDKRMEELLRPFDLPEILRPPSITEQCKLHQVPNPWAKEQFKDWDNED